MCGIAGIALGNGSPDPDRLEAAAARLGHRGPDDRGIWQRDGVALVHTRLSIIDLAGGHQPLRSADGRLTLVANGEIYNYLELRDALAAGGYLCATGSDCETILQAYARDGLDCCAALHGMFAFALHDAATGRLVLARDRLGMKPLFLAETGQGVAFASELKALLPLLPSRPELNPAGLAQYLDQQYGSGRDTVLQGVQRVLPGELVVIEEGRVAQRRRYWSATAVETRDLDFDSASRQFDELFHQVMTEHMRSDVPFGLFLSGGVDSSILLAALTRLRGEPVSTYSVGFDAPGLVDELPLAERVAERYASHHHPVAPAASELLRLLPRCAWAADDLMRDFASLPTLFLANRAARDLKVVFSGEGGDEAFAGYGRYRVNPLERRLKALLRPGSGGFRSGGELRGRALGLLGPELRAALPAARQPVRQAWAETPPGWTDLQRMQYVDLSVALPDNLLVKADRMLMARGLEGRLPFVDHRIVEFGLSLPDALKVDRGQGKLFLKRWAERLVDPELLYAPKRGFHVPVREWFGARLPELSRRLPAQPLVRRWFRPQAVQVMLAADQRRGRLSRLTFALIQLCLWHRILLEDGGTDPGTGRDFMEWLE